MPFLDSSNNLSDVASIPQSRATLGLQKTARDFGAVGDGVADDTASIQAALTAGYNVLFTPGKYRVTDTLYFSGHRQVVFSEYPQMALATCESRMGHSSRTFGLLTALSPA